MTKTKRTRSALISSVVSLFLCFTMLLGTTYAWFTDSVTSANNIIQSGSLKIDLIHHTATGDVSVKDTADHQIFNYEKWEPGYTQVETFTIVNEGTLALKYKMTLDAENSVDAKTGEKLSDVIDVYVCEGASTAQSAADLDSAAWTKLGTLTDVFAIDSTISGNLLPAGAQATNDAAVERRMFTIALHMQEDADNVYQALSLGELSVTLLATQYTYENDSFGNQYDKDAEYPVVYDHVASNSAELVEAFKDGGSIQLTSDITLEENLTVSEGADVYLDLNGKKITTAGTAVDPVFYTYKDSTLVIDGNGTVELTEPAMSLIFPGGDVIINSGTFTRNVPEGTPANKVGALIVGAKVSPWGSQTITINGGYFDGGYYDKNAADIEDLLAGTKTLTETADDIAKRGNSGDKNPVRVAIKNNTQLTLNLSYNLMKIYGGTFVGVNPAWGDEGCMLPTTPNYLRPWSYYQGALLDGQTFNENGIVLPEGYTITKGTTADGIPTYTVEYTK